MKKYRIQTDNPSGGKPVVHGEADTLSHALVIAQYSGPTVQVLHTPSNLMRTMLNGRFCWIDDHGREHPAPEALDGSVLELRSRQPLTRAHMHYVIWPDAESTVGKFTDSQLRLEANADGVFLVRIQTGERLRILQPVATGFDFTKVDSLSRRERQVFEMLADGRQMKEIADRMAVSGKTAETYRARLIDKLDVADSLQLRRVATEWALLYRPNGEASPPKFPDPLAAANRGRTR
jgi:DNA-binding CsgD family transcriptional regulator